jgi:hypothetical protein
MTNEPMTKPQGGNCKKFFDLFVFTSGFKLRAYAYNIRKIDGLYKYTVVRNYLIL